MSTLRSWKFFPISSFRSFIALMYTLRFAIYIKKLLCVELGEDLESFFFQHLSSWCSIICWNDILSSWTSCSFVANQLSIQMWAVSSFCLLLHWSSLQILGRYCNVTTESLKYFNIYQQSPILKNNLKETKVLSFILIHIFIFFHVGHFNPVSTNVYFVQFLFYFEELYLVCFILQGFLQCLVYLNCLLFSFWKNVIIVSCVLGWQLPFVLLYCVLFYFWFKICCISYHCFLYIMCFCLVSLKKYISSFVFQKFAYIVLSSTYMSFTKLLKYLIKYFHNIYKAFSNYFFK